MLGDISQRVPGLYLLATNDIFRSIERVLDLVIYFIISLLPAMDKETAFSIFSVFQKKIISARPAPFKTIHN